MMTFYAMIYFLEYVFYDANDLATEANARWLIFLILRKPPVSAV